MHIVVVGPGALGCLLASRLSQGISHGHGTDEHSITLLDYNGQRTLLLGEQGIYYLNGQNSQEVHIAVSSSPETLCPADVLILCVKSYDVPRGLDFCTPLLCRDTLLIFMQNGVAHLDVTLSSQQGTPAYGTTTEGAHLKSTGQVQHAGRGLTQFGFRTPVDLVAQEKLNTVTALFNQSELTARIADDILSGLWTKLMVNTGINGLTATLNCPNGQLLTNPKAHERMELLVREAMAVAKAAKIHVPHDSVQITRDVCEKTGANISSMLQDVRSGRRTEIDAINGAVVAMGGRYGHECPENARLVAEVKELERGYLQVPWRP